MVADVAVFAAEPVNPATIARYVAVDDVCAWPILTKLPNGVMTAIIHNQPSHGLSAGDIECWASADGVRWKKQGHPAPNDPHTIRMNVAAGLARNGDLLVLCSGWTDIQQPERPKQMAFRDAILRAWVCRSRDGGRTWDQTKQFTPPEKGWTEYIPFGPIIPGVDGTLHTSCYGGDFVDATQSYKTRGYRSWHFTSQDDGKTWQRGAVIGETHNETALMHLGGKSWLAAARFKRMELYRSDDDGATWQGPQGVTENNEINGQLVRLQDRRLLLSYGNRIRDQFGVLAKFSRDEGRTWSAPVRLARSLESDGGYPSSLQRPDGAIVTAYYAKRVENHERYHMGVAIWTPPVDLK